MRHFPDFLQAYSEYARDNYCPDKFHYWTGISIVAAALERKVWTVQQKHTHYPNLFVMLIAAPGDGKSTAGDRGVELLQEVSSPEGAINYIPPKITDAALVQAMQKMKRFYVGAQEHFQSASFYFASEASNALREIPGGGDIFPTITEAYDCKKEMQKLTVSKPPVLIKFPCMNVLACSTFNALKDMLTEGGIMGGFASRFLYVVSDEQIIRTPSFDAEDDTQTKDPTKFKLIQDLTEIHKLAGRFTVSREFKQTFEKWFPTNDTARYKLESEKEQAFLARKHTSIIKLAMIYSVSENSELKLERKHWERALESVESLEAKFERVISVTHDTTQQDGIDGTILGHIRRAGGTLKEAKLIGDVARKGIRREDANKTIRSMIYESAQLERVNLGGVAHLRVLVNS